MNLFSDKLNEQTEFFYQSLQEKTDYTKECVKRIHSTLNRCVNTNNPSILSDILVYIDDDKLALTSDTFRLLIIASLIYAENNSPFQSCFMTNVENYQDMLNIYMHLVLMLRRINLNLPTPLIDEALEVLQYYNPSPNVILKILNYERFEDYQYLMSQIMVIMKNSWSASQQAVFAIKIADAFPSTDNCISAAYHCLNLGEYALSLSYLEKIDSPTKQIDELISKLKEGHFFE